MAPDGKTSDESKGFADQEPVWECETSSAGSEILADEARLAADFLKALGHEGRLMMLHYLCERDHSVTELEQLIHSRQAAVSQQLARLRHEKLVSTRRDGNQIIYSLSDPRVCEIMRLIQRYFRHD